MNHQTPTSTSRTSRALTPLNWVVLKLQCVQPSSGSAGFPAAQTGSDWLRVTGSHDPPSREHSAPAPLMLGMCLKQTWSSVFVLMLSISSSAGILLGKLCRERCRRHHSSGGKNQKMWIPFVCLFMVKVILWRLIIRWTLNM